ncbi:MAG: VanZ family protein [Phycisphaerae bacterium]
MIESSPPTGWTRWYQRALPAYWLFLACTTHFPRLELRGPRNSDKFVHAIAFAILAFFFWRFCETIWTRLSPAFAWIAVLVLLAYAGADELTQPWFGRSCDLVDFLCDAVGVTAVLATLEWRRRALATGHAELATQLRSTPPS